MLTQILEYLILGIYAMSLGFIVLYSLVQLHLVYIFLKKRNKRHPIQPLSNSDYLPFITIQLPIYNEIYVAKRLLDSMANLDYPKDRYEIQVLDDSTDETIEIIAQKVEQLQKQGLDIQQIRRIDRSGFKAGALEYGLKSAKGDFIAIFDADFLPNADFLRASVAYFTDDKLGVVQARWEHVNQHYSLFTEALAFHLDAHFTIEQFGRDALDCYMNFNGTAGVWRKACIIDAGGWEHDTLTEDLDLSYRAQLKGWKFRYVDDIGAPAELPAELSAIKSQQYRWMKGGAEVARKLITTLWRARVPLMVKLHGTAHLLSSSVFIMVLLLGATSVPLLYMKHTIFGGKIDFLTIPIAGLFVSFLILIVFYFLTLIRREGSFRGAFVRFAKYFVPYLSLSMGLSLHNSVAVLQGYFGKRTPFIRTPKFDLKKRGDSWRKEKYQTRKVQPSVYAELLMAAYFCFGIVLAFYFMDLAIIPFMLMQALGYSAVGIFSFKHAIGR